MLFIIETLQCHPLPDLDNADRLDFSAPCSTFYIRLSTTILDALEGMHSNVAAHIIVRLSVDPTENNK